MNSKLKSDPDAFSKPFLAVSGIANPERFFRTLEDRDIYIKETMIFKDHHNYMEKDIDKLLSKCRESGIKNIAITEKDKIKIENFKLKFDEKNINCYVFPIRTTILDGKEKLIQMIRSIIKS
jgi:tetraacyldisaccharide 4'-kinase